MEKFIHIVLVRDEQDNLRWSLHGPNHGEYPPQSQPPWKTVFSVNIDLNELQGPLAGDYIADKLHAAFRAGQQMVP